MTKELEEVAHSGGKVTFTITTDDQGSSAFQVTYSGSRPNAMALFALWVLPQGIVVGGAGQFLHSGEPPPVPGCWLVIVGSDSEGLFGHLCPRCHGYWRGGPWPQFCPYCGLHAEPTDFLSDAQRRYVHHYCEILATALNTNESEAVIDMDAVADAASDPSNRPTFYVSEERQQHQFTCAACNAINDILGTYGYCSECGTRNDLAVLEDEMLPKLRERLNRGNAPEDCIRDGVAAIDSFIGHYAVQLAQRAPMVKARKNRLTKGRFHDLEEVVRVWREWFGIDLLNGVKPEEAALAKLMFHRRHVYEHRGGEADEKYIRDSGDTGVRLKQRLRNSQQEAHDLLGVLLRMGRNLHAGFHELLPPENKVIEAWRAQQERRKQWGG